MAQMSLLQSHHWLWLAWIWNCYTFIHTLFLTWIQRNEWKCNLWTVHCSTNIGKGSCLQAACDTLVFPAPQMWFVSAIRCYMREMKPLVSFLCSTSCYAYFKKCWGTLSETGVETKELANSKILGSHCAQSCVFCWMSYKLTFWSWQRLPH